MAVGLLLFRHGHDAVSDSREYLFVFGQLLCRGKRPNVQGGTGKQLHHAGAGIAAWQRLTFHQELGQDILWLIEVICGGR